MNGIRFKSRPSLLCRQLLVLPQLGRGWGLNPLPNLLLNFVKRASIVLTSTFLGIKVVCQPVANGPLFHDHVKFPKSHRRLVLDPSDSQPIPDLFEPTRTASVRVIEGDVATMFDVLI
jgi:hypothetical protein